MMDQAIPASKEINAQGRTKDLSELFPFSEKSAKGSRTINVHSDNRESDPFLPMLKEGLRALNIVDETAPAISGTDILPKMKNGGAVKGEKIAEGEPAIKNQMSGAENAIVSQESDMPQGKFFRILLLPGLPVKENSQDGPFVMLKDDGIKTDEWQIRNKEEIVLPLSPDKNQLAALIRIISDALKKHGFEDDRIGEILSEIKDKGLFTVKEDRKLVLPLGKSISEYGAGALSVRRATNAVYEMPEAGMKPERQGEQDSTGRTSFPIKGDLLSIGGDKNLREEAVKIIPSDSNTVKIIPSDSNTVKIIPSDSNAVKIIPSDSNAERGHGKEDFPSFLEKGKVAAKGALVEGPDVAVYGGGSAVNKASNAPNIDGRFLVDQIANQLSDEAGKGFGRVKITLSPQHLGTLDMDIIVRENKVHVVMIAEHHDVRQALQGHADQLKSALQQQGLQVHTMDFLLQGGHHGRDGGLGGGNLWWREENRKSENRNERAEKPSLAGIASSASGQKERQGVDGISVYV